MALNAALLAALLHYEPTRSALESALPIMVNLLTPPKLETPPVPPEQPKPVVMLRPQSMQQPIQPQPIIAAPAEAPTSFVAQPPEPKSAPPVETATKPEPAPLAPIIPPRFNAEYLHNPAPPYPALARRMGEHGRVVLRVLVSAEGLAERVELRSTSGSPRLDQSALDTVHGWKFVPARQGDQAVAAWVLVPIVFILEG